MKTWRIQCRNSGSVAAEMRFSAQIAHVASLPLNLDLGGGVAQRHLFVHVCGM